MSGCRSLEEAGQIDWFEEPVPPDMPEVMAQVARGTSIPIATGERLTTKFEFARVIENRAATILQPDLGRSGGGIARPGFERLLVAICEAKVGIVLAVGVHPIDDPSPQQWRTLLPHETRSAGFQIEAGSLKVESPSPRRTNPSAVSATTIHRAGE